ncbi:hypothetical protein XENOCAPTIV_019638, partial [Xenoophorus captivus]
EDLLPFQWCCINSSLCHLYLSKRPLDRCQGVVYEDKRNFAVRCLSVNRCAAVYASSLKVVVWRSEGYNQLGAMVEVPQNFYKRTVGLLGLWSSNRSDDFLLSDGKVLPSGDLNPPEEERLKLFCLSCEWTMETGTIFMAYENKGQKSYCVLCGRYDARNAPNFQF